MKLHKAVALLAVGLTEIPHYLHIHHKDCDVLNNDASNLSFMTPSDHKWIHKQYGSATLSAICKGLVSIDDAVLWSDDPARAYILLVSDVNAQGAMVKYMKEKFGRFDLGKIAAAKPITGIEFEEVTELSETERGDKGFGHTGV